MEALSFLQNLIHIMPHCRVRKEVSVITYEVAYSLIRLPSLHQNMRMSVHVCRCALFVYVSAFVCECVPAQLHMQFLSYGFQKCSGADANT